ncbi:MAG TPA: hypothetical protein DCM86_17975 [Verrucomicrobiales bacterium]|nr:hypothetical protein [Verrucomicrobiales bacterium]
MAALYATQVTKHDHSQRTSETLVPLARDLGLPVQRPYDAKEYVALARQVLGQRAYKGKTVIICWVHHDITELAMALGAQPPPAPWKDKTFDRLWVLKPDAHGAAVFEDVPQRLLPGDSKH